MNINEIAFGSKLYRAKGALRHVGVALENNQVLHITPDMGVQFTDFEGFANGNAVTIEHPNSENFSGIMDRANEVWRENPKYRFWASNCEHVASYVLTGVKNSPQLKAGMLGLAAYLTLASKPSWTGAALSVVGGVLSEKLIHEMSNAQRKTIMITC